MAELPYVEIDELPALFGYRNRESLRRALCAGTFPVPGYKIGNRWVIDREALRAYFRTKRKIAMDKVTQTTASLGS